MYKVSKALYFLIAIVMIFGLMGPMVTMPKAVLADTSGPRYSDTQVDAGDANSGTSWSNLSNIENDDISYATYVIPSDGYSDSLRATNFGFNIDSSATIGGIQVWIGRFTSSDSNGGMYDEIVQLTKDGTALVGNNEADNNEWSTSSSSTEDYGGSSNSWGTTWTPAQINAATFGVVLKAHNHWQGSGSGTRTASVDYIRITVTYTIPPPPHTITASAGPGGSISPSGAVTVNDGADQSFSITPDTLGGYIVEDVLIDFVADHQTASKGRINCIEFKDVHADHTITAIFEGGWKAPTAYDSTANDFANPSNAFKSDNLFASASSHDKFQVYKNFGLTVPAGSLITGISVAAEGYSDKESLREFTILLSWDGGITWTDPKSTKDLINMDGGGGPPPPAPEPCESTEIAGGCDDMWDRTWATSDFSNANFRVKVVAGTIEDDNGGHPEPEKYIYLDCLNVKLCYVSIAKSAVDLNGGTVKGGDTIRYTIEYVNGTSEPFGAYIQDTFNPDNFSSIGNFSQVGGHFGTNPAQDATGLRWPNANTAVILYPGESGSVSYDAVIKGGTSTVSNTACIYFSFEEHECNISTPHQHVYSSVCDTVTLTLTQQIPMVILNKKSLLNDPNAMWSMPTIGGHVTYSYVRLSTQIAQMNQPVTVYANAANDGYEPIGYTAILKINGVVTGLKSGSLEPNQAKPLEFVITPTKPGNYEVDINGQRAFFSVMGQEVVTVTAPADNAPAAPAAAPVSETIAKDNTAKTATYVIFGVMVFLAVLLAILVIQKRRTSY